MIYLSMYESHPDVYSNRSPLQESPLSSISLSDWRRNPFDVQSTNGEMCIGLKRNAVYFFSEMFLPALLSSMFTLSAVFFRVSKYFLFQIIF